MFIFTVAHRICKQDIAVAYIDCAGRGQEALPLAQTLPHPNTSAAAAANAVGDEGESAKVVDLEGRCHA
jgi:hypothetical protein